ncbi:hypothetical protein J437_LFUL018402, partial [Ladona fulva]
KHNFGLVRTPKYIEGALGHEIYDLYFTSRFVRISEALSPAGRAKDCRRRSQTRAIKTLKHMLMRKHFLFPSAQTLLSVLNAVPFRAGLNPGVLKHLSFRVSRMSELDKHSGLLFDEMSIKPSFAFNSRSDCIDGFEDHGSIGRSTNVA